MVSVHRFWRKIPVWISCIAGITLAFIVGLLVFGQTFFQSAYQNQSLLSNALLYPLALAAMVLMYIRSRNMHPHKTEQKVENAVFLFPAVLVVQFLIARCCWYKIGWDVGIVCTSAEELAYGFPLSNPDYFKTYPNNAFLTILHSIPLRIAVKIGLGVPYVVLPYVDAVLLNISACLCYLCVCRLSTSRTARCFALVLSIGWICLSPYILYPYTDTFSILFPVLAFYLYLRISRPVQKWFFISLVCFAGAAIKPTVLIILIALLVLSFCRFLVNARFSFDAFKRSLAILAVLLLGAVPGRFFASTSTIALTGSTNPQERFGVGYWFLTGMNTETYGSYSGDDAYYASSFSDYHERQNACVTRALERLNSRSISGNARFFVTKAYKGFADGSFASHNSLLELEVPPRPDKLSVFLRSLYLHGGELMPYCQTIVQCLWLGVLTLCAAASIRHRNRPDISILSLTLLGLTAYLLLFEVGPRYLFLYAPVFVILSSLAFDKPDMTVIK